MKEIKKDYEGFCKEQNKMYRIEANYVEARTLNDVSKIEYTIVRETTKCPYAVKHGCIYADKCEIGEKIEEKIFV